MGQDKPKKNILLLALSTLPKNPSFSRFAVKENNNEVVEGCVYQLEPVTKLMIKKFADEKELEIICLCTDATKKVVYDYGYNGKNAYNYFVERIKCFCEDQMKWESKDTQETNNNDAQNAKGANNERILCFTNDRIVRFFPIDIKEDDPIEGIRDAVDHIRKEKKQISHFWIDTHGGFRDVALIMESIVSVLKVNDIKPGKIYGVLYSDNKNDKEEKEHNYIVDQGKSFAMFDFVSGMNEFIEYGSVTLLEKYFEENKKGDTNINKLLQSMKRVSAGLQECNSIEYTQGLNDLGQKIGELKNDPLMSIFSAYIKDSYGDLLDSTKRKAIDVIERCVKHGFIQQALTFIESMMPKEFVNHGLIQLAPNISIDAGRLRKEDKWKNRHNSENVLVDNYCFRIKNSNSNLQDTKNYIENFQNILHTQGVLNTNGSEMEMQFVQIDPRTSFTLTLNDEDGYSVEIITGLPIEKREKAVLLFRMHQALKDCRNKFNHGNPHVRPSIEKIKDFINKYLKIASELMSNDISQEVQR